MFTESGGDTRDLLKLLLDKYKISSNSISKISGIKEEIILNFANRKDDLQSLSVDRRMDLLDLIMLLTLGMEEEDENFRVHAIIDHLKSTYEISIETIAIYAKLDPREINSFLNDYNSLSLEKRYRLGITVLLLHHICK